MMRFIMPAIFVGISVSIFFILASPIYGDISQLKTQKASYDEALNNSKALENERDKLTAKYNSINADNLIRLQKLLPENIDNIRLILEIEQIASPYGMALRDVKYNTVSDESSTTGNAAASTATVPAPATGAVANPSKEYGVWDLEFSTIGTYNNFINFTKDLEKNLRIVDISAVDFSSATEARIGPTVDTTSASATGTYKYNFKIKTYWLKN